MAAVLVVGGPGSGKSSVANGLRRRGLRSIDCDYGLARWEDPEGIPVEFPANPDLEWLRSHHWQWIDERFEQVLSECRERSTALCGASYNLANYLPRFELLILLQVDDATTAQRLADPRRNNDFGRIGATLEWSLDWRPRLEAEMLGAGAHGVDARQPLEQVVDDVIRISRAYGVDLANN
ncbi:hypothetical protein [Actinopolymorpha alba]|uniref:hypothetical protein n=1 Tax=Actinopolymorpha alba TaxID=533267 RepID=UPI00036A715B|nr:hypothetical protein [Actinopolymorpha alba]